MTSPILEGKDFSNAIQDAQYIETPDNDASVWRISHSFGEIDGQWFKVSFDHKFCNGLDAAKLFAQNSSQLKKLLEENTFPDKYVLQNEICWISLVDSLDCVKFKGPSNISCKEIIRDFYEQQQGEVFYIPIDMQHSFGAPALLNYTFNMNISFDANWDEVRRIKKNEGNYLAYNDEWKKHIDPQKAWITTMKVDMPHAYTFRNYDYDKENLQGLGLIITDDASYWNMAFCKKPLMKDFFIQKYGLTPLNVM